MFAAALLESRTRCGEHMHARQVISGNRRACSLWYGLMACEISYRFWQLACVSSVSERSCTSVGGSRTCGKGGGRRGEHGYARQLHERGRLAHHLLGLREHSVALSGSAHQLLGLREHEHANERLRDAELLREGAA